MRKVAYPHPGEILLEEFLRPMGFTQYRLAKEIGVPQRRIGEIVAGARAVTADTGLRLSRFFGMSDGFWIGLQTDYDAATRRWSVTYNLPAPARPTAYVVVPRPKVAANALRSEQPALVPLHPS